MTPALRAGFSRRQRTGSVRIIALVSLLSG